MHYIALTTGSCGNCYIFEEDGEAIIVDLGITLKKLKENLELREIDIENIKGLFITHFHPDHSKGVGAFIRNFSIPVYTSERAKVSNKEVFIKQKIEEEKLNTFKYKEEIHLGNFKIIPFKTYHDSEGSVGYFISNNGKNIFLLTDSGTIPEDAEELAKNAKIKFIESNYDSSMLLNGSYSPWLKKRVDGRFGHLSNTEAVSFGAKVSKLGDHVIFVHLSANNNKTEIVKALAEELIPTGIFIKIAERGATVEGFIE